MPCPAIWLPQLAFAHDPQRMTFKQLFKCTCLHRLTAKTEECLEQHIPRSLLQPCTDDPLGWPTAKQSIMPTQGVQSTVLSTAWERAVLPHLAARQADSAHSLVNALNRLSLGQDCSLGWSPFTGQRFGQQRLQCLLSQPHNSHLMHARSRHPPRSSQMVSNLLSMTETGLPDELCSWQCLDRHHSCKLHGPFPAGCELAGHCTRPIAAAQHQSGT